MYVLLYSTRQSKQSKWFVKFTTTFTQQIYRIRKTLESKSNMEDDKVAILEAQLAQAKQIAEEADRKYEEVQ